MYKNMEKVNIVFQALDNTKEEPSWDNSRIVHSLKNKPPNYDVTDIAEALSAVLGFKTIRYVRLGLQEKIDIRTINAHSGGYFQSHPNSR
jgi:hypothetical protein